MSVPTFWNPSDRDALVTRVRSLTGGGQRQWGKMTVTQMLGHLAESARMATGDLHVKPKWTPLKFGPLKRAIIYRFPMPKGAPTAPELIAHDATDIAAGITRLCALMDDFASRESQTTWPDHPAFGRMTREDWGALAWKHTDHHLRQFGA